MTEKERKQIETLDRIDELLISRGYAPINRTAGKGYFAIVPAKPPRPSKPNKDSEE